VENECYFVRHEIEAALQNVNGNINVQMSKYARETCNNDSKSTRTEIYEKNIQRGPENNEQTGRREVRSNAELKERVGEQHVIEKKCTLIRCDTRTSTSRPLAEGRRPRTPREIA